MSLGFNSLSPNNRNCFQFLILSVESGKNWKVFDFCNMFLQTANELEEATSDILQRLRKENVVYAEIRFCPTLHTLESLTSEEAIEAVLKGDLFYFEKYKTLW